MKSVALAAVLLMAALTCAMTWRMGGSLSELTRQVEPRTIMQQKHETSWTDSEGLTHKVTTPRNTNEPDEEWAARHAASVAALKAIFPPAA